MDLEIFYFEGRLKIMFKKYYNYYDIDYSIKIFLYKQRNRFLIRKTKEYSIR